MIEREGQSSGGKSGCLILKPREDGLASKDHAKREPRGELKIDFPLAA